MGYNRLNPNVVVDMEVCKMLDWIRVFVHRDLYSPFVIDKDNQYLDALKNKYKIVLDKAREGGADRDSLEIIENYRDKIIDALTLYYSADIAGCNNIVENIIRELQNDPYATSELKDSDAFPGDKGSEIQFFRCRTGDPSRSYTVKDMLHLSRDNRAKAGNYRFSIPGNPSLYLANSSYGCWIETGYPSDDMFNVAPVVLDGKQRILNLAIAPGNFAILEAFDYNANMVHCWLRLFMLSIATSFRVNETDRQFRSEYVISQSIMMACKRLGYDGVAYYSKRVVDELFASFAINLALFVEYDDLYSKITRHMKMDAPYNYAVYKKLNQSLKHRQYELRSTSAPYLHNISFGDFYRQYPYEETDFYQFDQFMFASWSDDRRYTQQKDYIDWGISSGVLN